MRTTLTLEPDVASLVKRYAEEKGLSFKAAVNQAIRRGLTGGRPSKPYRIVASNLGQPRISLVKALDLAAEMEDEEIAHKLREGR